MRRSGYAERIFEYQLALNDYAQRIVINDIPPEISGLMTEPEQFCVAIDDAMDKADHAGEVEMLFNVSHRLQELGIEPKDKDGNRISYFKLAEIIVNPVKGALWLGNPAYKRVVDEVRVRVSRLQHEKNTQKIKMRASVLDVSTDTDHVVFERRKELAPFF